MEYCKFIHYKIDEIDEMSNQTLIKAKKKVKTNSITAPVQWINCDLRHFDFNVLGHVNVVMLDPPWDIHMNVN